MTAPTIADLVRNIDHSPCSGGVHCCNDSETGERRYPNVYAVRCNGRTWYVDSFNPVAAAGQWQRLTAGIPLGSAFTVEQVAPA